MGKLSQLSTILPKNVRAVRIATAAQRGDLVAQQIMTEAGTYLGIAIASLINLLNRRLVVIGGGVSQLGDILLDPIRKTVLERCLQSAAKVVRITSAILGRRLMSMGAVVEAINPALYHLEDV